MSGLIIGREDAKRTVDRVHHGRLAHGGSTLGSRITNVITLLGTTTRANVSVDHVRL